MINRTHLTKLASTTIGISLFLFYFSMNISPAYLHTLEKNTENTRFYQINVGTDDASQDSLCDFTLSDPEIYLGRCNDGTDITAGFRFDAVSIPTGANICFAKLIFTGDGPYTNDLNLQIHGEATANSSPF